MKKVLLLLVVLVFIVLKGGAQDKSSGVEKSVWGVQIGIPPLAIHNESRIADKFSLRSELILGFAWQSGSKTEWAIFPVIQVEPRYYYNIKRRVGKDRRIDGNSGNYLSLVVGGEPGVGITSTNVQLYPGVYLIPTYGIRRNIGMHFNYEFAFGVGYAWSFHKHTSVITNNTYRETVHDVAYGIRIAIGYRF